MAKPLTAFDVLLGAARIEPPAVCVLVGDEGFLKHEVRRALIGQLAGGAAEAAEVLDGDAELRDVLDALSARSLFGDGRRVVVAEDADGLVKANREALEDYVARPFGDATLVLEVASWPGNTRLAKAVAVTGLAISCQTPDRGRELTEFNRQLKAWLIAVAKREFACELAGPAAETLIELLPSEPGILFQEVARLSLLGGAKIDAALVREHVGGWRARQTWDMIDAAADGRAADALAQLDRLLAAGEEPHALLPQMASTLRRFALAVRLFDRAERRGTPTTLRAALEQAGMLPFKLGDAERQLRQIGRPRARQLYRWLLAADLELKGYNSSKAAARRVIELLILRLSREAQAEPAAAGRGGR
jgi:DNA polymerase-3 subunit delta